MQLIDVAEIFASNNFDEAQTICKELNTIFAQGSSEDIPRKVSTLVRKRCDMILNNAVVMMYY